MGALLILTGIGVGCSVASQIERSLLHRTADATALYVTGVVAPHLQRLGSSDALPGGDAAHLADLLAIGPLGREIVSIKVWNARGRVILGTDPASVGRTFPVKTDLATAWRGSTFSRVSNLEDEENLGERVRASRLMETYTPVYSAGGDRVIAVVEFYQKADALEAEILRIQLVTWLLLGAVVLLWAFFLAQEVLGR